jgi:hypothetical protein
MRAKAILTLAALTMFALALPVAAQASITVANQNDSGPGSLREAIGKAPAGETINLPAGEYSLTSEELRINQSLTIAGAGAGSTKIGAGNAFRVLDIETPPPSPIDVTLSGLTVHQGAALEESEGEAVFGGGILAFETNLTLNGVVITENRAEARGDEEGGEAVAGGLFVDDGSLTMQDTAVTGNSAKARGGEEEDGGQAEGGGMLVLGSSLTMTDSTVSSNTAQASGSRGPGGSGSEGGEAVGGGLTLIGGEGPSKISGSSFGRNAATAENGKDGTPGQAVGGGIDLTIGEDGPKEGPLTVANSTIAENRAAAPGGDAAGGGAVLASVNETAISMTDSTIAADSLESKTGPTGEEIENGGGNLLVLDEAPKIFKPGSVSIGGSIIAGGVSPAGRENCYVIGKLTDLGFNLDSLDQCGFHGAGDQINANPLLGPLAANGGPTETMLPGPGSPAIDKSKSFGVAADQRGVARPIVFPSIADATGGDGSDIGAVEVQPVGSLKIGKIVKNKKKGTATVTVTPAAPALGSLTLKGAGLKAQKAKIGSKPTYKLKLVAKGGRAKALRKKGRLKVKFGVVYSPTGVAAVKRKGSTKLLIKAKPKRDERGKR